MNSREKAFLLLSSHLGDFQRRPLTTQQLRELGHCILRSERPKQDRDLLVEDLVVLGCNWDIAEKVVSLLSDEQLLDAYLQKGRAVGCTPLTRVSDHYPLRMRKCLDLDAPGCIWLRGNMDLLNKPAVALVGSRNLSAQNEQFARQVGRLAAQYGLVLISGNARGADSAAQESCLSEGGCVISVVADSINNKRPTDRILFISEDGFDLPFSNQRALSRNRLIHSMAQAVFVAQCSNGTGGTWDGTLRNLRGQWSDVYCMADGSAAAVKLYKMGVQLMNVSKLHKTFEDICTIVGWNDNQLGKNDKMVK